MSATHRWALTGTPIQNSLQDLYSIFRFLRHQPWCEIGWWKNVIADPYQAGEASAIPRLQEVLRPLLLRRSKHMVDTDGRRIVTLPPKEVEQIWVDLSAPERAFYEV